MLSAVQATAWFVSDVTAVLTLSATDICMYEQNPLAIVCSQYYLGTQG